MSCEPINKVEIVMKFQTGIQNSETNLTLQYIELAEPRKKYFGINHESLNSNLKCELK